MPFMKGAINGHTALAMRNAFDSFLYMQQVINCQEKELVTDKDVENAVYEGSNKRPYSASDAKRFS
ncbi:hypothetical protein [Pleionea mediterranea]|uniref:Uncharacterized protein n=1 Tax=Pleionea mediterranea TaxID=523701 RepID=A0A316FHK9_9GAMM|nr:hypothetical protein [Pleionea mediterranea]PWK47919.1 hypothetical protein C8D97_110134 [Pleionea mediterranea]